MQPDCEVEPEIKAIKARISDYSASASGGVVIKINKGKRAKVKRGWKGEVLDSSGEPIEGGSFTVIKVTPSESVGKVKLSVDQVKANLSVRLSPP